jgi:hypothetical protein
MKLTIIIAPWRALDQLYAVWAGRKRLGGSLFPADDNDSASHWPFKTSGCAAAHSGPSLLTVIYGMRTKFPVDCPQSLAAVHQVTSHQSTRVGGERQWVTLLIESDCDGACRATGRPHEQVETRVMLRTASYCTKVANCPPSAQPQVNTTTVQVVSSPVRLHLTTSILHIAALS